MKIVELNGSVITMEMVDGKWWNVAVRPAR